MNILFRCDGSVETGMGHIIRCMALADCLIESHNCKVNFAMRKSSLGINKVKKYYPVFESYENKFDYVAWLSDTLTNSNSDILVMDMRDGLTLDQLKLIKRENNIKIVTIDDPEDKRLESDLAFYPPVKQVKSMNWKDYKGSLNIGWEFVILKKDYQKKYPAPNNLIPNILISMGGTDQNNMTLKIVEILNKIDDNFKVTVLVGPGYNYLEELEKKLNNSTFDNKLVFNPSNVASVISKTDFALISFGQSAYEIASLNKPAITEPI